MSRSANGDVVLRAVPASSLAARQSAAAKRATAGAGKPAAAPTAATWAYSGEAGPLAWGKLKPEFAPCASGRRQSPIDLREAISVDLEPVAFHYQASAFSVIDNGHTVEVRLPAGNSIEVLGRRFELKQFHFHRPAEERIDGHGFDMSIHLVHADAQGKLAVVALLVTQGQAQEVIQTVWNNLPLEKGEEWPARAQLNPAALLPATLGYYTYMGSLTTPPCSEGVLWMVLKTPLELSAEQIDIFSRLYPMNARPVQNSSGRLVKQSR
jgi:carbonic anhydrase